ncbi:MAG: hypothetical protein HQL57_08405 [Magnetococcales bacterium]|nr:hypothetical protein [Magnetococcales bacterium]
MPAGSVGLMAGILSGAQTPVLSVVRGYDRVLAVEASGSPILTAVQNSSPGVAAGGSVTPVLTAVTQSANQVEAGGSRTPVLTAVIASRPEGAPAGMEAGLFSGLSPSAGGLMPVLGFGTPYYLPLPGEGEEEGAKRFRFRRGADGELLPVVPEEGPPSGVPVGEGERSGGVVGDGRESGGGVPGAGGGGEPATGGDGERRGSPEGDQGAGLFEDDARGLDDGDADLRPMTLTARMDRLASRLDREVSALLAAWG